METMKKVLVLEDDVDLLKLITEALSREKLTVISSTNGTEGLMLARKEHPDLILVDLDLPGTEGLTVVKELRADDMNIPAIIFSNSAEITDVGRAMEEGVLYYLPKSDWELEGVVAKVKEALKME